MSRRLTFYLYTRFDETGSICDYRYARKSARIEVDFFGNEHNWLSSNISNDVKSDRQQNDIPGVPNRTSWF